MAFTASISTILQATAKVEATYGTDPTPVGGTDDALLFESPAPVDPNFQTFELRSHSTSWTKRKDIIGRRTAGVRCSWLLQGSGALGTATVTGFAGQAALLQCAGITQTASAGTSITWAPSTRAALKSTTAYFSLDGVLHKVNGLYASVELRGDPNGGVRANLSGEGLYVEPLDGASGTIAGYAPGANRAEAFLGVAGTINNGASYTTAVLDSFVFRSNATRAAMEDANSATGLKQMVYTDRSEDLELVIALDTDSGATIPYKTFYANTTASATHNLTWYWGTSPNKFKFNAPTAQLRSIKPDDKNGYRIVRLGYKLQHATDESQWAMTIGNPS